MCRFRLLAASLMVVSSAQASSLDHPNQPRCSPHQLDIRLLARHIPSSLRERWLFAIVNRGKQDCYLSSQAPWLLGEGADGVAGFAVQHRRQTEWLSLPAQINRTLMGADRIVWFSVELTRALRPDFSRLHIRLAGLHQRTFTLPLSGNRQEIRNISPLSQDIRRWFTNGANHSACNGDISSLNSHNWTVNLNNTVTCNG